ncbi:MAG: NRDE family protein [Pseudomonadales bacterium]
MCTLTWRYNNSGDGYALFFNRDELKTRQRAAPPSRKFTASGVAYLAPTDADAGGTWLAVNQFGLTICLLNNYAAPEPGHDDVVSRGEVVTALAGSESIDDFMDSLEKLPLQRFRGFELVVFANTVAHWRWDTRRLERLPAEMPITSSSYETGGVQAVRREFFERVGAQGDLAALEHFHCCHIDHELHEISGQPLAVSSVCMHREFAQTVSQSFVQVWPEQVSISYTDGPPCENRAGAPLLLQRRVCA